MSSGWVLLNSRVCLRMLRWDGAETQGIGLEWRPGVGIISTQIGTGTEVDELM